MGKNRKSDDRGETLVDQVYEQIQEMLYNRGLSGVESLSAGGLADSFGVSRTPVNMALIRLESEGLIRRASGKGWVTVPLTLKDVEEIFDLKDVLEPLMVRRAAENITPEAAAELSRALVAMEEASETGDLDAWLLADRRYHDLLFQLAASQRLHQFLRQLNHQLYRLWIGYSAMEGRMAVSCAEHQSLGQVIMAGDADRAAREALRHSQSLRDNLTEVIKNVLIPFLGRKL
jgi:DNA-binding GntR family transcriptional regulator